MFLLPDSHWIIKKTKSKGRGVFAKKPIKQGVLIGDYVGKLIRYLDLDLNYENEKLYLMYYNDESGIYPDLKKPGVHLINHSCSPNCWIMNFRNHTIVFALENIEERDEITISYLLPPKMNCDPCNHKCFCKSSRCTGTMHLTERGYQKWQNFQYKVNKKDKPKNEEITDFLKPLIKYPKTISKKLILEIKALRSEMDN